GNVHKNVETIQKTLADFGISVAMSDVNVGPTVTQYTLKPAEGVKLANIVARNNDLSLSLAAHPIRIEAPIPGKSAVGIEVPNKTPALVTLREVLESKEFKNSKSNLTLSLGRDVAGQPIIQDLKNMPHLLIAGATGSGKSICLHSIVIGFLYQNSPADLRLIMIDPKRVEFTFYNDMAHLLAPVITDVDKIVSALKWVIAEMDRRFNLLQKTNHRNIESYNQRPDGEEGKLPYLVIIIDELADLMAQAANEVEGAIVRLAQLARATGIHLILATQRPSVDVITGLIKANITSRIAFAVASGVDSRTILDTSGAEKLLGKGDMLFLGNDLGKPRRLQGSFLTDKEIQSVVEFIKNERQVQYDSSVVEFYGGQKSGGWSDGAGAADDELYEEARAVVTQSGKASASLLQRRLRIGYARAARLLDIMEEHGVIGPADGARPRDILSQHISPAPERENRD
ncbi:MAG: DNA segregation ATPase FtsK/SpoIIIE, S-DNA-T family, partial [Candidatus Berkelbacteria bacterium Licking1014_2]